MTNKINCPNCGHAFVVEDVLSADLEKKYKTKFQSELDSALEKMNSDKRKFEEEKNSFEEKKKRENEIFQQRMNAELQKKTIEIQEQIRKETSTDFEYKLKLLENQNKDQQEKLAQSRKREEEFLKEQQKLKIKEEEIEITIQRKLLDGRNEMQEQIRQQEAMKNEQKQTELQLQLTQMQKKLDDQSKMHEEALRKAQQGSMQLQGEGQELLLEDRLAQLYPFDKIEEIKKGVEGADCIQYVRNNLGVEVGKIIYESKNAKAFSNGWIEKLKTDMRNTQSDIAILVTKVFPKDMDKFGEKDGILICRVEDVAAISAILRQNLLRISTIQKNEENKGEKMQMLYQYLTGNEFRGQVEAILEGFMSMKNAITREKVLMEKIWKEREKQLDKVLINTSGMFGAVKGIAGSSVEDIPMLDMGIEETLE